MKLRITIAALCVIALAAPIIATSLRFSDVPADHEYADAIRWASDPASFGNRSVLFKGYGDGTFDPDKDMTDPQFDRVVKRLFDSQDSWTRGATAAFLYYGWQGLYSTTTTTGAVSDVNNLNPSFSLTANEHHIVLQIVLHNQSLVDEMAASFQLQERGVSHRTGSYLLSVIDDPRGVFEARIHCNWGTHRVLFQLRKRTPPTDFRWLPSWNSERT